jgi:hypothetical protein
MKTTWGVFWSVTSTGGTHAEYKTEDAARRRVKHLQDYWGEQITRLELDRYEDGSLDKTEYIV